jgi:hypothetical protein
MPIRCPRAHCCRKRSCALVAASAASDRNVTEHPTAAWTAQQIVNAFPAETAPAYLLRDRDTVYGHTFREQVKSMGICDVLTARHSP